GTARSGQLPDALTSLEAWVACIAGARRLEEIAALLELAGLVGEATESHDDALAALLDRIEARLKVAALLDPQGVARGGELVSEARRALDRGLLGYGVVITRRP